MDVAQRSLFVNLINYSNVFEYLKQLECVRVVQTIALMQPDLKCFNYSTVFEYFNYLNVFE